MKGMSIPVSPSGDELSLREQMAAMQAELRAMRADFDRRADEVNARFDSMQARSDARFDAVQATLVVMQTNLATVQAQIQEMQASIAEIKQNQAAMQAQLIVLGRELEQLKGATSTAIAQSENRTMKWYVATTVTFFVLFSGLVYHSQRSFEYMMSTHIQTMHQQR